MLTSNATRDYARFRKAGYNARESLQNARTLAEWREYENEHENSTDVDDGCVRIRVEAEQENYFDVFGEPDTEKDRKRIEHEIELNGCWWIVGEYLTPDGEWVHADSIGMNTGYKTPDSPFENWYIPDIMRATLDAMKAEWAEHEKMLSLANELAALA